ncbi:MAG: sensor histidine kinase [Solirubrobacteraceae bacterium]
MGRRRQSARLRLTLLFAGAYLALGTIVIVLIFAFASGGSTIQVSSSSQVVTAAPSPPGPALLARRLALPNAHGVVVAQRSADLQRLLVVSWLGIALTALAAAAFGWFASGRTLRPLREMTAAARMITAGSLGRRVAQRGRDDEFRRLGDTFDELLARLEASFEAQRRFVANASHELRTPLTLDRTLLQVALADPDVSAGTLRATCEELLASGREQERLLEALLTLATSERGLEHREPLDLATLADRALRAASSEIERRALQLSATLHPAPVRGDAALLERLIANLLDNAVGYNDDGGRIDLITATGPDGTVLTVANTGPPVAAGDVARLFEPFQRLGGRAADGAHHGLGLSIVRAVAAAHGASLQALPGEHGGLTVTVTFSGAIP